MKSLLDEIILTPLDPDPSSVLITSISILFFYLFYLSIPNLYNKSWTQKTIEYKIFEDFKINFSI